MNVCHIISGDLWAGAECQAFNLLCELTRNSKAALSAITFNPGRLTEELKDLGIKVSCLPEGKLSSLGLLRRIRRHISEHEIDIMHCHGHKEHILGCVAGSISKKHPKLVRTLHGMPEPFSGTAKIRSEFFEKLQHIFIRHFTDNIIVVSRDMEHRLSNRSWANKMICIHNGIDIDRVKVTVPRLEMRRNLGVSTMDFVIGTACRLVPVKRIDLLLETFQIISQNYTDTLLLICGDGPLLTELQGKAESLGIASRVRFLSHRDDIYDVMSTFDVFVMTSEHEGIPMVLLEAMVLGIPLIVPDIGGIREIVRDDRALLTEPLSAEGFARSLSTKIENRPTGRDDLMPLDRQSLEMISVSRTGEEVLQLYDQLNSGKQ